MIARYIMIFRAILVNNCLVTKPCGARDFKEHYLTPDCLGRQIDGVSQSH